jgi:hypothetical protein
MAGLGPAIHEKPATVFGFSWMPGPSPGKTTFFLNMGQAPMRPQK